MKIYIWEGNLISSAYHNDGTLVVLAETPEQAREIAIASAPRRDKEFYEREDKFEYLERTDVWQDGYNDYYGRNARNPAIDRPPDRIIDLDEPCVVAFNGGGYD